MMMELGSSYPPNSVCPALEARSEAGTFMTALAVVGRKTKVYRGYGDYRIGSIFIG